MSYYKYEIINIPSIGYGMIKNNASPYEVLFFDGNKEYFKDEELNKLNDKSKLDSLTLKDIINSKLFEHDLDIDIDSITINYEDIYDNVKIEPTYVQKIFTKSRPILIKIEYKNNLLLVDNYNSTYIKESIAKLVKIARTYYIKEDEKKAKEIKSSSPLKETFKQELHSSKSFLEKYVFLRKFFKENTIDNKFLDFLAKEYLQKNRFDILLDEKTYLMLLTFFYYHNKLKTYFVSKYEYARYRSLKYDSINESFELIRTIISIEERNVRYSNELHNRLSDYYSLDRNILLIILISSFELDFNYLPYFLEYDFTKEEANFVLKNYTNEKNLAFFKIIFKNLDLSELKNIPYSISMIKSYLGYYTLSILTPSNFESFVDIILESKDINLKNSLIFEILDNLSIKMKKFPSINKLFESNNDFYINEAYKFRCENDNIYKFNKNFENINQFKLYILHLLTPNNEGEENSKIHYEFESSLNHFGLYINYKFDEEHSLSLYEMDIYLSSFTLEINSNLSKESTRTLLDYVSKKENLSLKLISFFNKYENYYKEKNNKEFYDELSDIKIDNINKRLASIEVHLELENKDIIHKIGIDKFYKIRNIQDFLSSFGYGLEKEFSKYFTFTCEFDNLEETSKEYLYYINTLDRISLSDYDYLDNLFKIYKNHYIFIGDDKYLVKLDSLDRKILIKNDYTFEYDKLNENYEFINDSIYCYNKITKEINVYSSSPLTKKLLPLIKKYNPNIKKYIEDFKYKYYLNSEEEFNLENDIESIFKKKELIINSYYSLNKNYEINVKDELFLNGDKTYYSSLNPYLQNVYNVYKSILEDLGFINDKLPSNRLLEFLKADLSRLRKISNVFLDEKIQKLKLKDFSSPTFTSDISSGVMSVIKSDSEYTDEELFKIYKSLEKNEKFVILNDDVIDLNNDDSKKFKELVEDYNLSDKNELNFEKKLPLYYAFKNNPLIQSSSMDDYYTNFNDELKNYKNIDNVKLNVNADLRDYQKEAYNWLNIIYKYNLGGILADDMGLGKTLEVISFISTLEIKKPILIVTPTSLIFNWINEFNKFLPSKTLIPIYGKEETRKNTIAEMQNEIYITSYDTLRNDLESYKEKEFELIILDEAQFIKNSNAKKTQSVKEIKADHKLVLTGTPIENSVSDLWSLFDFLMPGFFPQESNFKSEYLNSESYRKITKKRVTPFILKRTKEDSLNDLPSKEEIIMTSEMNSKEREVYEATRIEAKNILDKSKDFISILGYLTLLREICIDPSLVYSNFNHKSSKLDLMEKITLDEISKGNRVLIFSQFVKALEKIENKLNENNIKYLYIDGQTKSEDRVNIANEFNNDESIKVCVISLKAGGTGLNLTGANIVIHLDPWWNYSKEAQASDRVYRIGQTKDVKVYKLVSQNTVEENVIYLQNKKKELAEEILSDSDKMTKLTKEDLMFLLNE